MPKKLDAILVITFLLFIYLFVYFILADERLMMDERMHYSQIVNFSKGNFIMSTEIAMGPGYHIVMAALVKAVGSEAFPVVRFLHFILSLICLGIIWEIAAVLDNKNTVVKFFQLSVLPTIFAYYFILFTDVLALLFFLLSFYFILRKRYLLAGLTASALLIVRQNYILWFPFLIFLIISDLGWNKPRIQMLLQWTKECRGFLPGIIGFIIFFLINGGITRGGGKDYLPFIISLNNIYLLLFLMFVFFFLENIHMFNRVTKTILYFPLISIPLIATGYFVFLQTLYNTHPWNGTWYFLRNQLMITFTSSLWWKSALFIVVVYQLLVLINTHFIRNQYTVIHLFGIASLIFVWLIEPRYSLPYLALFILTKKIYSKPAAYISSFVNLAISLFIVWGLHKDLFFP